MKHDDTREIRHMFFLALDIVGWTKRNVSNPDKRREETETLTKAVQFEVGSCRGRLNWKYMGDGYVLALPGTENADRVLLVAHHLWGICRQAHIPIRIAICDGLVSAIPTLGGQSDLDGEGYITVVRLLSLLVNEGVVAAANWAKSLSAMSTRYTRLFSVPVNRRDNHGAEYSVVDVRFEAFNEDSINLKLEQSSRSDERKPMSRRLDLARMGVPFPEVIEEIADHLAHPDPETKDLLLLPVLLSMNLNLHSTFSFRTNATECFRATLETVLFHELYHSARAGEEGAQAARLIRARSIDSANVGQLVYTDADHPSIMNVCESVWPENPGSNRYVIKISDIISRGFSSDVTKEISHRFCHALKQRPTQAVVMPHVVWFNGAQLNILEVCRNIKEEFPLTTVIIDGAQAVGHIPIDIEDAARENADIDFYFACGHKWLRGPETIGFMRFSERIRCCSQCCAFLMAGDSLMDGTSTSLPFKADQSGTHQRGLAKGFCRAIELMRNYCGDLTGIYNRIKKNADGLRAMLKGYTELEILDPPLIMQTGIVAFRIVNSDTQRTLETRLLTNLERQGFYPCVYKLPRFVNDAHDIFFRFSPGPDFTEEDLAMLDIAIREALRS